MGKVVLMNTPKTHATERTASSPLRDERAWIERLLQLQPLPALLVDVATGQILLRNEPARRVMLEPPAGADDYFADDTTGNTIRGDQLAAYLAAVAQGPPGVEIGWHTPHRRYHFHVLAGALQPPDGSSLWCLLSFVDITAQREAEAELRHALDAREEFFSVATHELKDPLFSLQLSIQLLRHQTDKLAVIPEFLRHHLEVSRRQVDRLTRLVENLLDVSRIANRRLQLDPEAMDLAELAHDMAGRFHDKAVASATPIHVDAAEPVIGYFDRLKLEQVLSNLLSNALKYGPGQPIEVRVRDTPDLAIIEVEDHGMGIAPEDQLRVFDRFERAAPSYKRESLGLGLHIVRSLVEAHGGTVSLVSAVGIGSTFTVTLPRKRLPARDSGDTGENPSAI